MCFVIGKSDAPQFRDLALGFPWSAAGDWRENPHLQTGRHDPAQSGNQKGGAVTFILDGAVAEAVVLAIGLDAMEREASICLVRQQGEQTHLRPANPGVADAG